jgi:tetratricopeptide (TPR) repeat protein
VESERTKEVSLSASQEPAATARPAPWSPTSLVLFGLLLTALLGIGVCQLLQSPRLVQGLPDDPSVRAALMMLNGPLLVSAGDLRFETSLDREASGDLPVPPPLAADMKRLGEAERWLREGQRRHRFDPRYDCLLGHLDVARHRYEMAERHYATAVARASRYGEARLAYGVTLALEADTEGDQRRARRLLLRAIGQLAAVDPRDPFYLPALYDRALLLDRVGRPKDAVMAARRYVQLEPGSVWSASLMRMIPGAA